ncbi:MAG: teichoic acid biosynthesis protein C [Actinophytocola sp.]|uniref:phage baseplate protein n=1 Tax=Actinophytocola sp. TaxID=1872138 RepID=UPI003C77867E
MSEPRSRPMLSRRSILRAGGGCAATAALLGTGGLLAGPAAATVPTSQYFDITKPSYDLFRSKMLHESHHAMQGFAFDNVNHRLFIAQIQNGSSGDDLCVNQVDFSGNRIGSMHLPGAGHGVSIGVEAVGTDSYIWMECDSNSTGDDGRGTALARFKFVNGGTPSVRKFLTGSKTITCATDPVHKRIAVRRNEGGRLHYSVYSLAAAAAGDFSAPLAHFPQPALSGSSVTFQGYTIYGNHLYTLDGTGHADPADINSYVTRIDMNTGTVKSRFLTKAGKSLIYREPEGMAVYRTSGGETRLFLGFASRSSMSSADRYANIFYKNVLVG